MTFPYKCLRLLKINPSSTNFKLSYTVIFRTLIGNFLECYLDLYPINIDPNVYISIHTYTYKLYAVSCSLTLNNQITMKLNLFIDKIITLWHYILRHLPMMWSFLITIQTDVAHSVRKRCLDRKTISLLCRFKKVREYLRTYDFHNK